MLMDLPTWIPAPWNMLLATVGVYIGWMIRRNATAQRWAEIAQKALDLVAYLLSQGESPGTAVPKAVAMLQVREGIKAEVAQRVVAGALEKLRPTLSVAPMR